MARFYGKIGYAHNQETEPNSGIFEDVITEQFSSGKILRNSRKLETGEKVNDDLSVGNSIEIVSDAYSAQNFFAMRYIEWLGALWIVTEVTVERPRLILRLGGVYNGPTAAAVTP